MTDNMESDVKEEVKSECPWRVDEEDEERYNFTDEKGLWQPKPGDILSMFDQLSKGGALTLQWTCPGRRPPESEEDAMKREESRMEVDNEDSIEEAATEPEPCAFDFDDTSSETSVKAAPIRTLGGLGRTPRTEKRVARMDNIMDSLRKQQIQRNAEREARKAKGSPGRTPPARGGRLLKFGSPPAQTSKIPQVKTSVPPITAIVNTTEDSSPSIQQPFVVSTASESSISTSSVASTTTTGVPNANNGLNVNCGGGNSSSTEKTSVKEETKDVVAPLSVFDKESKVEIPLTSTSVTVQPSSVESTTNPVATNIPVTSTFTNQVPDQSRTSPVSTSSSSISTSTPTIPSVPTAPVTTSAPLSSPSSSLPSHPQPTVSKDTLKPEVAPSSSNPPVSQLEATTIAVSNVPATSSTVVNYTTTSESLTSKSPSLQTSIPKPEPVLESTSVTAKEENETTKESS